MTLASQGGKSCAQQQQLLHSIYTTSVASFFFHYSLAERAVVAAAEMSLSILFLSDEILSRISSRRPATGTRRLDALIHPDAKMLDALRSDVWPRRRRHTKIINELRFISGRPAGTYAVTR